jgi:hypothetical protein
VVLRHLVAELLQGHGHARLAAEIRLLAHVGDVVDQHAAGRHGALDVHGPQTPERCDDKRAAPTNAAY